MMDHNFRVRDLRKKDQYKVDDAYLNGYARLCGVYATAVYNSLSRHADYETQACFPSIELIAEQHNISKPTVIKAIRVLQQWNIVSVSRNKDSETKRQLPNVYLLLDKSEWVPKDSRVNHVDSEPSKSHDKSRVNHVYHKDTHIKDTHIAAEPRSFSFGKYLEAMENHKNRHVQVIGFFFREKGLSFDTKEKAEAAIRRHLRAAKALAVFSDNEIVEASKKAQKDFPGMWTIETLTKILTK